MLFVVLFIRGGRDNQVYGIKIVNNSPYITTIVGTQVCHQEVTNNKYVNTTYYYLYSITPYISYENPVLLTTTTTNNITSVVADPYHISHHEVCIILTT